MSSLSRDGLGDPPVRASGAWAEGGRSAFAALDSGALPGWALVHQRTDTVEIADVRGAVRAALGSLLGAIAPGSRACVAVGSRGIDRIDEVTRVTVERLKETGADVFIVPAMGSHGGATPQGQLDVLAGYGITPESMGCEIRSSMETVELGEVAPGVPVFIDRRAFEGADFIIPINRVKPHTDFRGEIESGLMKMIAIGLGNQRGADTLHRQGFDTFRRLIPAVAKHTLERAPIPFGLAIVENGHARLLHIEAVPAKGMLDRERELLAMARAAMARLPIAAMDVLVLDEIGKDISGLGMDPNVIGRYHTGLTGSGPNIGRIVVRDLTSVTEGSAVGIGLADIVLRRAVEKIDYRKTYMNCITAKTPEAARIPLTVDSDREALSVAIACCPKVTPDRARVVRVRDTKHLEFLYVNAPALFDALSTGICEVVEPLHPIGFDAEGMFVDDWPERYS